MAMRGRTTRVDKDGIKCHAEAMVKKNNVYRQFANLSIPKKEMHCTPTQSSDGTIMRGKKTVSRTYLAISRGHALVLLGEFFRGLSDIELLIWMACTIELKLVCKVDLPR